MPELGKAGGTNGISSSLQVSGDTVASAKTRPVSGGSGKHGLVALQDAGGRSAVESLSQSLAAKWDSKGFGGGSFSSRYSGDD